MDFFFNMISHEYFLDGKRIPSVTELLPEQNFHIPPWKLKEYQAEGIANHEKIQKYIETRDDLGDPYLKTFQRFLDENRDRFGDVIASEEPRFAGPPYFAGTPDLIFRHGQIVDVKRSFSKKKIHALQLAGYSKLAFTLSTNKRYILVIKGDDYKLTNVYDEHADDIFMALVRKWYLDQSIKAYLNGG